MLDRLRQWPGPPTPMAAEASAHEQGLRVLGAARPHIPTQRVRFGFPLAATLLGPLPILLGNLPHFLLLSFPIMWMLFPWLLRSQWLATQTTFCADRLLVQRGEREAEPHGIPLLGLNRIEATQDPVQARTGSCTLRFLHVDNEDPTEPGAMIELAVVRDVENTLARRLLEAYAKEMAKTRLDP